jgi:type I restriction enzyme S subunit
MEKYVERLRQLSIGGVIKYIKLGMLTDAVIPLPPLEEQKRIAAILDKADEIRRKRQQAIELADQFLRSVFLDMFGDAERLWQVVNLEDIAAAKKGSIRTGPFGSQLLHSEFTDSGIAVLGIDNAVNNEFRWAKPRFISEEKYESLKRYTVRSKDLIITIMGTCGRCAIVPEDVPAAINTKHLCCISLNLDLCVPEFLHAYFLMHPVALNYLRRESKGAVMDGLNMAIIKEMPVHLPPIEMQQRFAGIVDSVSEVGKSFDLHGGQTDMLFKSLVQESLQ